jgi:DHA1 family multidrug resistance protein-like MFS transporter
VAVLGFSLVAPIFPIYVLDLGASYTLLGIVVSIYGAVQLLTQVPIGRLSDRAGRKRLILLGLISFALLPLLYLHATNAYVLIPIRVLGGIGASAVWPLAMALIVDQAGRGERGRAMGWYNAAFYSALALGPFMGGVLYELFGLAGPFYFWSLLGAASVLIVFFSVKEPRSETPLVISSAKRDEGLIKPGYMLTFLACCGVVLWAGIVGGFNFAMLPSLAAQMGLSTLQVGLLYLVYGGTTAVSNIYFGGQADRGRRKILISAGCLAGALSFSLLTLASDLLQTSLLLAVLGTGLGIGTPAAAALIADTTCESRRGEIFGLFNTARMAGVVIGPLFAGLTADMYGLAGTVVVFSSLALVVALSTLLVRDPSLAVSKAVACPGSRGSIKL